ncbi:MAG: KH domain-containing protein [Candidatus Anstonellales archaeon]
MSERAQEIIKIPAERVAALIGENERIKKEVEDAAGVRIKANEEGEVMLEGDADKIYFAKDVVRAIGRGFEARVALKILKEGYHFHIINLKEYANSENAMRRIKGRIIGEKGRIKSEIENASDSYISVYGHTVCVIGPVDSIDIATEAISMIIEGAMHSTVLNYLAKARKNLMLSRIRGEKHG